MYFNAIYVGFMQARPNDIKNVCIILILTCMTYTYCRYSFTSVTMQL
jgi:hypothetical protein